MAYNRFKVLLAEAERVRGRQINYAEIKERYGIAESTLSRWASNSVRGYSGDVVDALCDFFNCEVGELVVNEPWPDERPLKPGQEDKIKAAIA